MMRSLALLLITLVSALGNSEDFGSASWGDSFNQVLLNEKRVSLTPTDSQTYLVYDAPMLGLSAVRLIYFFENDKLVKGAFVFYDPVTKTQDHFYRYQTINELVAKKYGNPQADDTVFQADGASLEKTDALMQNKLMLQTTWRTNDTLIEHQLAEDDGEISHQLVYKSLKVQDSMF